MKIYRVVSNDNTQPSDSSKVLWLHGTEAPNVEGILKTGFKPSKKGSYGAGVYMTDSFSYASNYGKFSFVQDSEVVKKVRYIFVNEVEELEGNMTPGHLKNLTYEEYLKKSPFVKTFDSCWAPFVGEKVTNSNSICDVFDSKNNKILQGTFEKRVYSKIIALAHHSLVAPAYLLEIEEIFSLKSLIDQIVYLDLGRLSKRLFFQDKGPKKKSKK